MYRRLWSLAVLFAVLSALVAGCVQPTPVAPAQAPAEAAAGEAGAGGEEAALARDQIVNGGTWTRVSSADASNLNPILQSDSASSAVSALIFPGLIGEDPVTGELVPEGSMSESWEVSEDGLTYTFHLREGITWSDGDPVDSADFKFTYDAINSELVESPRKYFWEEIDSIEAPDPLTVVVTMKTTRCDALRNLVAGWLPSHLYADDFSDIMNSPDNEAPRVSAGPLMFQSWTRDDNIIGVRNEGYWEGTPHMDGMIYRVVPNPGARLAQLQSGEIDVNGLQPDQVAAVQNDPNLNLFSAPSDGYTYIGLNLADPANPQPGEDEDGNLVAQDPHPILGDVRVRQAIAYALDYQSIIDNIYLGQGQQQTANVLPAVGWAYHSELEPYTLDTDKAMALLEDAGWTDSDGDGIRDKDGKKMEISLLTNAGNSTREDIGVYVQDQLNKLGMQINFEAIDFGTLIERMDAQTVDMFILGWIGLGSDPNDDAFWMASQDIPGSGFNYASYQNATVEELLAQGASVPGCKPEDRAPIYKEIQEIIHEEVPYIFLINPTGNTGYTKKWGNVDPQQWGGFYWNVHDWYERSLQP